MTAALNPDSVGPAAKVVAQNHRMKHYTSVGPAAKVCVTSVSLCDSVGPAADSCVTL